METNSEISSEPSVNFPEGTSSFSFQVGGHVHGKGKQKLGVLKHKDGYLVKPLIPEDKRSLSEFRFYQGVNEINYEYALFEKIQSFIPKYHGIWETIIDGKKMKYLCLEDLCDDFHNPSVLDIKMGRVTYDEDASEKKKNYEISKYTYGEETGIRLVGMKVYDDACQRYFSHGKKALRAFTIENLQSALKMYLSENMQINCWFLCAMIHKLDDIREWFSTQTNFRFIASSILLIYEGNHALWYTWARKRNLIYSTVNSNQPTNTCELCGEVVYNCSKLKNSPLIRVSMIDFGHVKYDEFEMEKIDENYLPGIENLVKYFKLLLDDQRNLRSSR